MNSWNFLSDPMTGDTPPTETPTRDPQGLGKTLMNTGTLTLFRPITHSIN